jgi:hypothetical protein
MGDVTDASFFSANCRRRFVTAINITFQILSPYQRIIISSGTLFFFSNDLIYRYRYLGSGFFKILTRENVSYRYGSGSMVLLKLLPHSHKKMYFL